MTKNDSGGTSGSVVGGPAKVLFFKYGKVLKKEFRKLSRQNIHALANKDIFHVNQHFRMRRMTAFWNMLKKVGNNKVDSSLNPKDFSDFYSSIMTEDNQLNADQQNIEHFVTNKADGLKTSKFVSNISASDVEQLVKSLK